MQNNQIEETQNLGENENQNPFAPIHNLNVNQEPQPEEESEDDDSYDSEEDDSTTATNGWDIKYLCDSELWGDSEDDEQDKEGNANPFSIIANALAESWGINISQQPNELLGKKKERQEEAEANENADADDEDKDDDEDDDEGESA